MSGTTIRKQSISNIRQKLLQERLDKTNPRRTLTIADEQRRLFKLEAYSREVKA